MSPNANSINNAMHAAHAVQSCVFLIVFRSDCRVRSHATDLLLVGVLLQARIQMLPPLKEHRLADELEPRRERQVGVSKLLLQLLRRYVCGRLDFILVDIEVDIRLDEEDVVDCMTTILLVALLQVWGSRKDRD